MTARTIVAACLVLCIGAAMAQGKAHGKTQGKAPDKVQDKADQDTPNTPDGEAKEVSGMSIVGNSETPKSLTIIPWKSSEIGRNSDLKSSLLNQDIAPIDKPTFLREVDFYKLSTRN